MKKLTTIILSLTLTINVFAQQWTTKSPMSTARVGHSAVVVNGIIYVIGGADATYNNLGTVEAYNPTTDTWTTKNPMPTPRGEFAAVAVNGKIYCIGGYNGGTLNTVEEYNPSTDTWSTKASMPTDRAEISADVINGKIYVVGGWPGGMTTNEEYNPLTNSWATKAPIVVGNTQNNGCAVLNNQLFLIGGKDAFNSTFYNTNQAYDPALNSWTNKANLPQALWNGAATVLNNEIHYLGGASAAYTPNYNSHYVYNSLTNSWTSALPMLNKRSGHTAVTVNGKIYVIGGIDSASTCSNGCPVNWNEEYSSGICYQTITVTDTLVINANITGINPVAYQNTIKIFPNPTNDQITIDYGSNYSTLTGYTLKILNSLSQTVFTTTINSASSYVNLSTWTGNGVYFVHLINPNGNTIDIRKIVLQ